MIAVCIAFPIVAHSSTDVAIARMFDVEDLVGLGWSAGPPVDHGAPSGASTGSGPSAGRFRLS